MASTKSNMSKKAMLEALTKSLGIVTTAAKLVKIDRKTHYEWLKTDPKYREAVDDLSEVALDFAESRLHGLIREGNPTSVIFFLKTKGRSRGYIERQELSVTDHSAFVVSKDQKGVMKILKTIKEENQKTG